MVMYIALETKTNIEIDTTYLYTAISLILNFSVSTEVIYY